MLHWFYCLPLESVLLFIICLVCLCGMLNYLLKKNHKSLHATVCIIFIFASIGLVILTTMYQRPDNIRELIIRPFQSFIAAKEQPEMYRTMLMNVTLFLPYGLSLSMLLSKEHSMSSILLSVIISSSFISIIIEVIQFVYSSGLSQTDDVLCNVLGATIGTVCIIVENKLKDNILNSYSFK